MGDVISGIFGSSTATEQETVPDAIQREMNLQRLNQVVNLFQAGALNQFAGPGGSPYEVTDLTRYITDTLRDSIAPTEAAATGNLMSLEDYRRGFDPVTASYERGVSDIDRLTAEGTNKNYEDFTALRDLIQGGINRGLERSNADYNRATDDARSAYGTAVGTIDADYNAAIARGDYDYARALLANEAYANRSLGVNEAYAKRSLGTQDANRARALKLGIGATGNYIDQIATPRLKAELALQGLETSGAVPASIARATAETAMPYLQSIENTYGTNQANTLNTLLGLQSGVNTALQGEQAALSQSTAEGNRALGSQRLATKAAAGNTYQQNVVQLAQAMMANNITLEQAGIAADSALGQSLMSAQNTLRTTQQQARTSMANTYNPLAASFAQSMPAASTALSLLPGQVQAQRTANLTALQPLADFPRQLQEADYLRRQGLFTTAYTGIPFQSGSTTYGGTATGNIFDQLGGTIQSGFTGGGNIGGT